MATRLHADNTITTSNLRLRPLEVKDVEELFHLSSWESQDCFCTIPLGRPQCRAWIREHMNQNRYMTYCVEQFPETPKNVVTAKSIKTKNCYVIGLIGVHALPRAGFWWDQQYRKKEYVSEAMKAWVQMYWHRYPNGHPSLLRMENWVLWAKTKSEDAHSRTVMEKSGFVDVGKRVVGVGNNRRLADHWILLKP